MHLSRRSLLARLAKLVAVIACSAMFFLIVKRDHDTSPLRETIRSLSEGNQNERLLAARDLGISQSEKAIPALMTALHDPADAVRTEVIVSLKLFGTRASAAVPELCGMLREDRDPRFRRAAAEALELIAMPTAVLGLIDALEDPDEDVRAAAAKALSRIGPGASSSLPNLIAHLERDSSASMRRICLGALIPCAGKPTKERDRVVTSLVRALQEDPDAGVRFAAANTLTTVVRDAAPTTFPPTQPRRLPKGLVDQTVPRLIEALDDQSREVREAAASGLAWIGLEDERVVPALCRAVRTSREPSDTARQLWGVWMYFADDEPSLETAAVRSALQALLDLLDMKSPEVRGPVLSALFKIVWVDHGTRDDSWREETLRATQAVLAMIEDEHEDRQVRVEILYQMGNATERITSEAIRSVCKALASIDSEVRTNAAQVLCTRSREHRDPAMLRNAWHAAIPTLITALRDPEFQVRRFAASALGNLGPEAMDAREPLSKLAREDPDPEARHLASEAIKSVGGPSSR
ncbi:HEAT repeat domain-containing protein [Singulisphaera rosea]